MSYRVRTTRERRGSTRTIPRPQSTENPWTFLSSQSTTPTPPSLTSLSNSEKSPRPIISPSLQRIKWQKERKLRSLRSIAAVMLFLPGEGGKPRVVWRMESWMVLGGGIRAPELIPVGALEWKTQEATSREDKGKPGCTELLGGETGKCGSPRGQWVTAPGERRFGAERIFREHESANSLPHRTLAPVPRHPRPKRTPQTCSWSLRSSLLMGPNGCGQGRALRRARLGARAKPRFRYRDEAEDQRDGAVGGRRDLSTPADISSSCRCSGDDCSSLALLSSQPQLRYL